MKCYIFLAIIAISVGFAEASGIDVENRELQIAQKLSDSFVKYSKKALDEDGAVLSEAMDAFYEFRNSSSEAYILSLYLMSSVVDSLGYSFYIKLRFPTDGTISPLLMYYLYLHNSYKLMSDLPPQLASTERGLRVRQFLEFEAQAAKMVVTEMSQRLDDIGDYFVSVENARYRRQISIGNLLWAEYRTEETERILKDFNIRADQLRAGSIAIGSIATILSCRDAADMCRHMENK